MPHKQNPAGRHHIPKMRHSVTNWREYEVGLRRRGSLTMWITDKAIAAWRAAPRKTPGGQAAYSDSAIPTCLMLRAAFKLPLRQAEGLMLSAVELLGCALAVLRPQHRQPQGCQAHVDHARFVAERAAACADRQHGAEGLRRRRMAG